MSDCQESASLELNIPISDFIVDITKKPPQNQEIPYEENKVIKMSRVNSHSPEGKDNCSISASRINFPFSNKFKSTLHRLISTFYITTKFITNLRNFTVYRNPKALKNFHYKIINDNAYDSDGYNKEVKTSRFEKTRRFIQGSINFDRISKIFIIHPYHIVRITIDIIILIITSFHFIAIPIGLGFYVDFLNFLTGQQNIFYIIKIIMFMFFIFDIFLNFNTAILDKGELIVDRKKITKHYLSNQFITDTISLIFFFVSPGLLLGFDVYQQGNENESRNVFIIFSILFFLKLINFSHIINRIEGAMFLDESTYNKLSFLKLICIVFLFAHISACVWHYIGFMNQSDNQSWLIQQKILDEFWWKRYLRSLYYVVVVMNTLGFGDIVPQNDTERVFNIFFIYIGCSVFAYIINSIGIVLQNINKKDRDFKRKMYLINGYMRQKNINFQIISKIRNYLEYIWNEEKEANGEEVQQIINKLSNSLKNELILSSHCEILKNIPFFFMNFSEDTLNKLSYEMKEVRYTPGDVIYNHTDVNNESNLYIIRNGKVEIFINHEIKNEPLTILQTYNEGDIFGQISFLSNQSQETSARSSTFTTLYVINKENFMKVIKRNDHDFQVFCRIKDQLNFSKNFENLYSICASCHNSTHSTKHCPMFHVTISKQRVIDKLNYSVFQERSELVRRNQKKFKSLMNLKKIKQKLLEFQKHYIEEKPYKSFDSNFDIQSDFEINLSENSRKISNHTLSLKDSKENEENNEMEHDVSDVPKEKTDSNFDKKNKNDSLAIKIINNELESFETLKEYNFYFPKNNIEEFIDKYNGYLYKKILKQNSLSKRFQESFIHRRSKMKKFKFHLDKPLFRKVNKTLTIKESEMQDLTPMKNKKKLKLLALKGKKKWVS